MSHITAIADAAHLAHRTPFTDPQYAVLDAAERRGDGEVLRFEDASVSTLRSLARKHLVTLEHHMRGARKVVVSAHITPHGREALAAEREHRAAEARRAALTRPQPVQIDPFAVTANTAEAQLFARIDAAFSF